MTNATDALRAKEASVADTTDALLNVLCAAVTDWDGSPMTNFSEPRELLTCGDLRDAIDHISALQAEVARHKEYAADAAAAKLAAELAQRRTEAEAARLREDAERLDYIERTFSGMTNRERYLPVQMIWGKGCNGRTLREACDKYMKRDAAMMGSANGQG